MKRSTREKEAISEAHAKKTGCRGNLGCALFSLPFFLAGAIAIYFLGLSPALKVFRASSWEPIPCVVTSSKVATGSGGDTYSVEIHYSYTIDGKQYPGTRYGFFGGSSSGFDSKARVVEQYPAGSTATCYVNPLDPTEAVISRGVTTDMLWGLFGVPFLLVGLAGPIMMVRSYLKERKRRRELQGNPLSWPSFGAMHSPVSLSTTQGGASFQPITSHPISSNATSARTTAGGFGRVVLEPATTPARKLMVTVFFTLIWNGIVSVFVYFLIKEWNKGHGEWILALFLIPFVLIGMLLLYAVAHGFLALFNPRPRLTINSRELSLGETFDLDWEFSGSTRSVKQLRIYLEGREEATYRRGTDTAIDKNVFTTIEIAARPNADPGRAQIDMPADTMHSFESGNNKIVWEIHIKGDIRYWSDVDESFEIEVLPKKSLRTVEP